MRFQVKIKIDKVRKIKTHIKSKVKVKILKGMYRYKKNSYVKQSYARHSRLKQIHLT